MSGERKPTDSSGMSRVVAAGPRSCHAIGRDRNGLLYSQLLLLAASVAMGLAAGCKPSVRLPKGLTPVEQRGYRVFEQCYYHCHILGIVFNHSYAIRDGSLGFPPDLSKTPPRTRDWYQAYLINPQAVLARSSMPSFGYLPDKDLEGLVAFLRYLNRAAATPAPELISALSIPETPKGLAGYNEGRAIYQDNCRGCHGEWGNGAGPVGQVLSPEPRDFTDSLWMSKQTEVYLFSVITNGKPNTAMPAFRELLNPQERALVLRYLKYFADSVAKERMELGELAPSS